MGTRHFSFPFQPGDTPSFLIKSQILFCFVPKRKTRLIVPRVLTYGDTGSVCEPPPGQPSVGTRYHASQHHVRLAGSRRCDHVFAAAAGQDRQLNHLTATACRERSWLYHLQILALTSNGCSDNTGNPGTWKREAFVKANTRRKGWLHGASSTWHCTV